MYSEYAYEETEIVMCTSDVIDVTPPTHWSWLHSDILIETDDSSRHVVIMKSSIDGYMKIRCDTLTQNLRRLFCFDARDEPYDPGTMCYIYRLTWFAMPIPLHDSRLSNPTIRFTTNARASDNGTIKFTLRGGLTRLPSPRSIVHADHFTFEISNEDRNRKVWKIPIPKSECLRNIFCVCREESDPSDTNDERMIRPVKFSANLGMVRTVEESVGILYGNSSKYSGRIAHIPLGCLRGDIPYWTGAIKPCDGDFVEIHVGPTVSAIELVTVIVTIL
jgi:hypothetical protein